MSAGGVDQDRFSTFRILEFNQAHIGHGHFHAVAHGHGNDVMAFIEQAEWLFKSRFNEIGHHKHGGPFANDLGDIVQSQGDVGLTLYHLKGQQFPYQSEHMPASLLGRDIELDLIGKDEEAHFVVVLGCGKGQDSTELRCQFVLHLVDRAELSGRTQIHGKDQGHFTLFHETLDIGLARACRDIPVDIADIVTGRVFAHLVKLHAATLEHAFVLASEARIHGPLGQYLNVSDFLDQLFRYHGLSFPALVCAYGTSILSKIICTMSSLVLSSASAS